MTTDNTQNFALVEQTKIMVENEPLTIIFDPHSADSMLASCFIVLGMMNVPATDFAVKALPYNRFNGLDIHDGYGTVVVVGVELTVQDLALFESYVQATGKSVRILAYRDQYQPLGELAKKFPSIEVTQPFDEYVHVDMSLIDNSMCSIAQSMFSARDNMFPLFADMKIPVVMHLHGMVEKLSYEKVENNLASGSTPQAKQDIVKDAFSVILARKASVISLRGVLMRALLSANVGYAVQGLRNEKINVQSADIDNYRATMLMIRTNVTNNMRKEAFGRSDKAVYVDIMACPINLYPEMFAYVKTFSEIFMTYEDTRICRIYRIYAEKAHVRHFIAEKLNPHDTWTEGTVTCCATDLPRASKAG